MDGEPSRLTCLAWAAVVLVSPPACIACGLLPDPSVGWQQTPTVITAGVATLCIFAFLSMLEVLAHKCLERAFWTHPLLSNPSHLECLARHVMDTAGLACIGYMGFSMWRDLAMDALPHMTAHDRVYLYLPRFAWTCVAMLAFQIKNLFDTLKYGDGPEFVAHHLVCIFVAIGALHGTFLHLYGIFFFGLSEISTALVSALAIFDDKLGVPELGELLPLTKMAVGGTFTIAFITIRIVVWPYLAYHVYLDCTVVLADNSAHSPAVVRCFLACLLGLTVLQVLWLFEIFRRAPAEIRATLHTANAKKTA